MNATAQPANKISIYKHGADWCYALWIAGEFDSSGTLDVLGDATENEAREYAIANFSIEPNRVYRVADVR
jgi:hypothetical protein